MEPEEGEEEDTAALDLNATSKGKAVVIKTSTRYTIFLPVLGMLDANEIKPGELIGVNKDSYLLLEKLPPEYDARGIYL